MDLFEIDYSLVLKRTNEPYRWGKCYAVAESFAAAEEQVNTYLRSVDALGKGVIHSIKRVVGKFIIPEAKNG